MFTENSKDTIQIIPIEPVTTILDDGKFFRIRIELPGIAEEKILIILEKNSTLVVSVTTETKMQYKKVISMSCKVRFGTKRFSNGVLELNMEKLNSDVL